MKGRRDDGIGPRLGTATRAVPALEPSKRPGTIMKKPHAKGRNRGRRWLWVLLPAVAGGLFTLPSALVPVWFSRGWERQVRTPPVSRRTDDPGIATPDERNEQAPVQDVSAVVPGGDELRLLNEEQLRRQISRAMQADQDARALAIIQVFPEGQSREEECQRLFGYFLKKGDLDHAAELTALMRNEADRAEARDRLATAAARRG